MRSTAQHERPVQRTRYRGSTRQNLAFRDQSAMGVAIVASVWLLVSAWILQYPATEQANDAHLCEAVFGGWALLIAAWRFQRPLGGGSAFLLFLAGALMAGAPFYVEYGTTSMVDNARISDPTFGTIVALCGLYGMFASWLTSRRARARGEV
ncbi:MAG TPA: hypothetical protein VFH77_02930 [Streptomyces sp.]|jgi:hypothetical protein|nr:hypothetical protein [Streptomyces sp.]